MSANQAVEYGVDRGPFIAGGYTLKGARFAVAREKGGKGSSHPAARVMRREVGQWEAMPDAE